MDCGVLIYSVFCLLPCFDFLLSEVKSVAIPCSRSKEGPLGPSLVPVVPGSQPRLGMWLLPSPLQVPPAAKLNMYPETHGLPSAALTHRPYVKHRHTDEACSSSSCWRWKVTGAGTLTALSRFTGTHVWILQVLAWLLSLHSIRDWILGLLTHFTGVLLAAPA